MNTENLNLALKFLLGIVFLVLGFFTTFEKQLGFGVIFLLLGYIFVLIGLGILEIKIYFSRSDEIEDKD